ncbi:hypothetical protein EBU95_15405 [bacterium]|nr:hypothetical protein [bacterium]
MTYKCCSSTTPRTRAFDSGYFFYYNYDMNLEIGQFVELRTRRYSYLYKNEGWVENTLKGQVVPNPKWLDDDYVSILTDHHLHPVSMVFKQNIIGFDMASGRSASRMFNVKSKKTGKQYRVVSSNGSVTCDCIGFQYRKTCKHVTAVKKFIQNA